MFEGDRYASYIELCREMRMHRTFEPGDVYVVFYNEHKGHTPGPRMSVWAKLDGTARPTETWFDRDDVAGRDVVWSPRLDQWLDMLEEAGFPYVEVWRCGGSYSRPMYVCGGALDGEEPPQDYTRSAGRWPTREEAAGRLFQAVAADLERTT